MLKCNFVIYIYIYIYRSFQVTLCMVDAGHNCAAFYYYYAAAPAAFTQCLTYQHFDKKEVC